MSPLLLPLQAAFLEILAAEGEEGWAAGEAAVAPLLHRKPELAAEAAALAKSKGEQVVVVMRGSGVAWKCGRQAAAEAAAFQLCWLQRL